MGLVSSSYCELLLLLLYSGILMAYSIYSISVAIFDREFFKYALLDYLYSWERCSLFPLDCQRKITIAVPSERLIESKVCDIFVCNAAELQ